MQIGSSLNFSLLSIFARFPELNFVKKCFLILPPGSSRREILLFAIRESVRGQTFGTFGGRGWIIAAALVQQGQSAYEVPLILGDQRMKAQGKYMHTNHSLYRKRSILL